MSKHIQSHEVESEPGDTDVNTKNVNDVKDQKFSLHPNASRYFVPKSSVDSKFPFSEKGGFSELLAKSSNEKRSRSRSNSNSSSRDHDRDRALENRDKWNKILLHPAMIGLYAGIFVFILLCIIQPPFVMRQVPLSAKTEEFAEGTQQHLLQQKQKINWITVTVVSLVTAVVVGITPYLVELVTKSIQKNKNRRDNDSHDHDTRRSRSTSH